MADPTSAPRRVSMAYILGFSNKPFKDGGPSMPLPPPPRHPSAFKQMIAAPGGVLEWTASDGRRGRLTGPGKPRVPSGVAASVPAEKAISAAADEAAKELMGMGDVAATVEQDSGGGWTPEQDKRLLELKNFPDKTWVDIAVEVGKDRDECRRRFKEIQPKDWRPPNGGKKQGGGKQGHGSKENGKQGNSDKKDDSWDTQNVDGANAPNPDTWSGHNTASGPVDNNIWGLLDNTVAETTNNAGGGNANQNTSWDSTNNDTNNSNNNNNNNNNNNIWGPSNATPKPSSHKSTSKSRKSTKSNRPRSDKPPSHSHKHSTRSSHHKRAPSPPPPPSTYELKPDDTFSASDLRLIAHILQQDCSMVWQRVSWRFKDKTGRSLHPEVFEEKVTGRVEEGRES